MDWTAFSAKVGEILDFVLFGEEWDDPVTLRDMAVAFVILVVANLVSRGLRKALAPLAERMEPVVGAAAIAVSMRVIHWITLLVGVVVALATVDVRLSSLSGLFTAGAVVTVAIGFAMQNIAQNFVSGALLATERSIKAGDVIEVEGQVLRVQRIGIRTTVARSRDDEEIIIPNSTLVQNAVKNFTYQDSLYRLRATVGVAYGSDMRQVMDILHKAGEQVEERASSKRPRVLMREFGSSSVNFEVSVWTNDPWRAPQIHSKLMEAIWWSLAGSGVTIAFPQMDLHVDPDVVDALRARDRPAAPPAAPDHA